MMPRWPLLIPFVCMSAGTSLFLYSGFYCNPVALVTAFFLLCIACFTPSSTLFSFVTAVCIFLWGTYAISPWLSPARVSSSVTFVAPLQPHTLQGVLCDRPSQTGDGGRVAVRLEHRFVGDNVTEVTGTILLFVSNGEVPYKRGDRIRFISTVTVPRPLGLPGEFNYRRFLALQNISATCRVANGADIVLINGNAEYQILSWFDRIADQLSRSIRQNISDQRVATVLSALLLGDQRRIPRELSDAYTRSGVNHILSISGFHVGIIAACVTWGIVWLLTRSAYLALHWNVRRCLPVVAVPIMFAYMLLTGCAPATARSVIMLTTIACAVASEREQETINSLLLAAFLLVAINPPTLCDVSFQLSFISLWGILLVAPRVLAATAHIHHRWLAILCQFTAISCAASMVTILPALYIFNVATLNGIVTNFIIVPLLGYGAVLSGFVVLPFIALLPQYTTILLWPAATMVAMANRFIHWCATLPVISYRGITAFDMALFLISMLCLSFYSHNKRVRLIALVLLPTTALAVHIVKSTISDGMLHVRMLSVGQAESLLITLPDKSHILIDGGGYLHETGNDFGQRVLAPALSALGIQQLRGIIATHDHPDHSGGLAYIMKNFPVATLWNGSTVPQSLVQPLQERAIRSSVVKAGDVINLPGGIFLHILAPLALSAVTDTNEQSIVFRLQYGEFSMLFCADAGFFTEQLLINKHSTLRSTVLKVGHHGSRYSTSENFLMQVQPRVALISAGYNNRFGLPADSTLALLKHHNSEIYRTDEVGTIDVVSDGHNWSVSTPFKPD